VLLGFLHTLLLGLGIFALIGCCGKLTGSNYVYILALGLALLPEEILAWILLRKIHGLLLYVFSGFATAVLLTAINYFLAGRYNNICNAVALATFSLCMFIVTIHARARIRHGEIKAEFLATQEAGVPFRMNVWEVPTLLTHPSPRCMAWFCVQYLIGLLAKMPLYWRTVFYLALLDLFVCFAFQYLHQFTIFLQDNHATASLPTRTIRHVHRLLLAVGAVLLMFCITPSILYNREPLSEVSLKLSRMPSEAADDNAEFLPAASPEEDFFLQGLMESGEVHEPPEWLIKAMHILLVILLIALVIGVLAAAIRAIRYAMLHFAMQDEDEVIFLTDEDSDAARSASLHLHRKEGYFSINRQIRRRYKKTIRKATTGIPDCWATPSELEASAGLTDSDRIQVLHEVYEKARYSKDGASREDASRLVP
jgi:hypothetical protein